MAHKVKCCYCGKIFDRDKIQCVQVGRRYAHIECAEAADKEKSKEEKDKQELEDFIKKLFGINSINARIRKQINTYINDSDKKYTYSGIRRTLEYFYYIRHNSIEKSNGGIGIVPYVYDEAYRYYYNLWVSNNTNKLIINNIDTSYKSEEIIIPIPHKEGQKRKLFKFLDEEN